MSKVDKEFEAWLETRPEVIKELAKKYPPGEYIIKPGAPYGISCEGTKVILNGYREDGTVFVVVLAENKLPAAIEHEKYLSGKHGKDADEIHARNVQVNIDPIWMEAITE